MSWTSAAQTKGGVISQKRRKENPEYYRRLGCKVRNKFTIPLRSDKLAEFVGIVLGDGSISRDQCQISLSYRDDKEYANYVRDLAVELFAYKPTIREYEKNGLRRVIFSGIDFVEMLIDLGLKIGHKIRQQVDIPNWIKNRKSFLRACMRGLFDTDGGTFTHKHMCGGHKYCHFGLNFTSASMPLLNSFCNGLNNERIKHGRSNIYVILHSRKDVKTFFNIFEPHNMKHFQRYQAWLGMSTRLD